MADSLKAADIGCIAFGAIGALTNLFLFWVTVKERNMNKKFAFLFKNLAANDFINAIAIPVCWYNLEFTSDTAKSFRLTDGELTFFCVSLCTISVQHPLIFIIGLLRYKILQGQGFLREFSLKKTKVLVAAIWICCLVIPLLIYFITMVSKNGPRPEVLDILPRVISAIFIIGAICAAAILLTLLIRMTKIIYFWHLPITASNSIKKSHINVFLFLLFTVVFSILPAMFCFEMIACGPVLQNKIIPKESLCFMVRKTMFLDVKLEYSLMFLSLCLMSIANGTVFLLQPSLRSKLMKYLRGRQETSEVLDEEMSDFVIINPLHLMKQEIEDERSPSVFMKPLPSYGSINYSLNDFTFSSSTRMSRLGFLTTSMKSDN